MGDLERGEMDRRELGIVVEHLLEVRDQPEPVGRVAVITAVQVVADAAAGHPVERHHDHLERVGRVVRLDAVAVLVKQEQQVDRLGELGPARIGRVEAEPAVLRVKLLRELLEALGPRGSRQRQLALAARGLEPLADGLGHVVGRLVDLGLLLRPGFGHRRDNRQEPRRSLAITRRKIRPAEERAAVGRQEQRHRPAPGPERLKRGHVHLVDVGPLLAVDLDAHEARVQCPGDLRIDKALALHDVAPVARAIADRQKDRLVLGLGLRQRLGPPRIPVHRVVGVQEQVGARFLGQPVGRPVLAAGASSAARATPADASTTMSPIRRHVMILVCIRGSFCVAPEGRA